jgi:long-chain acyl-CoA synthetase
MVMRGYWRQPDTTQAAFRDGWLRSGDGGRMDAHGYLFIVDRLKDMIISGGENVYSGEVEAALRSHPAVAEAAVIGLPDPQWGEAVHAVIVPVATSAGDPALARVLDRGLDQVLRDWCRQRLAGYKCPRSFSVVPQLPMSAAGKVLKHVLRTQVRR